MVHYNYKALIRGYKQYELSNHLGNVLAVISDKRVTLCSSSVVSGYEADVVSSTDYYTFGSPMAERTYSSPVYRYGFNGKEKTDEVNGEGNALDFGARIYDSRLGRWLSVDPMQEKYANLSCYNFAGNSPVQCNDPDGTYIEKVVIRKDRHGNVMPKWKFFIPAKTVEIQYKIHNLKIYNGSSTDLTDQQMTDVANKYVKNITEKLNYKEKSKHLFHNYTLTVTVVEPPQTIKDISKVVSEGEKKDNLIYLADRDVIQGVDNVNTYAYTPRGTTLSVVPVETVTQNDQLTIPHEIGHELGYQRSSGSENIYNKKSLMYEEASDNQEENNKRELTRGDVRVFRRSRTKNKDYKKYLDAINDASVQKKAKKVK